MRPARPGMGDEEWGVVERWLAHDGGRGRSSHSRLTRRISRSPSGPVSPFAPASCLRSPLSQSRLNGFTLIELLVVLVIVAVLAVAVTLAVAGSTERQLENEAERFRALLAHACNLSELTGREIGAVVDAGGYGFQRLDGDQWRAFGEGELHPRRWPGALRLGLERGGRPLELATPAHAEPQLVCFSSGELTPFALTLALGDGPKRWRVSGRDDGALVAEPVP